MLVLIKNAWNQFKNLLEYKWFLLFCYAKVKLTWKDAECHWLLVCFYRLLCKDPPFSIDSQVICLIWKYMWSSETTYTYFRWITVVSSFSINFEWKAHCIMIPDDSSSADMIFLQNLLLLVDWSLIIVELGYCLFFLTETLFIPLKQCWCLNCFWKDTFKRKDRNVCSCPSQCDGASFL